MSDRQRFCVIVLSVIIIGSAGYLGYYIFIDHIRRMIDIHNSVRFYIFFGQHLITLAMLLWLLKYEDNDSVIKWMFQLSSLIVLSFIGGEVFTAARGGRVFGNSPFLFQGKNSQYDEELEFEINEITLYFQIMTDFIMFFIVSAIAMIVLKCRAVEEQERFEFMVENLKSEDYVDEPNAAQKKSCAICLTDLENQRVIKVPCEHVFHKECLVNWLKRSTICPLCRTDIQESLSPESPYPRISTRQLSRPEQIQIEPQQLPQLTFANNQTWQQPALNSVRNRSNINTHEINNNIYSRVSIGQNMRRNEVSRDEISTQVVHVPPLDLNRSRNKQRRVVENCQRSFSNRPVYSENVQDVIRIQIRQRPQPYTQRQQTRNIQNLTPRSMSPNFQQQNNHDFKHDKNTKIHSQPFLKAMKTLQEVQDKNQNQRKPSQEQIGSPEIKFYRNPNQKKYEMKEIINKNESQQLPSNKANQMLGGQIVV